MGKLWSGRFSKETDETVNAFNSSIAFDSRMYKQDIHGSIAHVTMLGACGIIPADDADKIARELDVILSDIESGKLEIDPAAEDIHTFIETQLTARLGQTGKMLHTARSRNDQVAVDLKLYLKEKASEITELIGELTGVLNTLSKEHSQTVMPGYTHLQRAQPITFGMHTDAYAQMFSRDTQRLADWLNRMNFSPLGAGALAGVTYPTDRKMTAAALGFRGIMENTLDCVSDRDFCVELAGVITLIMVHLSRLSEEIILWTSWEFKFIELDDAYATGSSIMPQKKNPDIPELIRGKTGRVIGDFVTLATMLKGLPLAYNKDMQEDKEAVFDAADTVLLCLKTAVPMLRTMRVNKENMRKAAAGGFINATDCADYLVKKGIPFRDAYKITGELVALCIKSGLTLETLPLEKYREYSPMFAPDVYDAVSLDECVRVRKGE